METEEVYETLAFGSTLTILTAREKFGTFIRCERFILNNGIFLCER
jgi:hypothetical protein